MRKRTHHEPAALLPLGALAAGFGLMLSTPLQAQTAAAPASAASAPADDATLPQIKVKAAAAAGDRDSVRATTTTIGKGKQELRDVPQSVTVVTQKLIEDRKLDTLKEVLHQTAGISFLAAEGGEEDIRLRGFSLAASGDIFLDGMRDPAFYERDTFNNERIELLRGSASMLFGRGSTGGAVNQVNKQAELVNENAAAVTLGNGHYVRVLGDLNVRSGEHSALRINVMDTQAQNWGNKIDKQGLAVNSRWGIDQTDEFSASFYYLNNENGINYGMPWVAPYTGAPASQRTLLPVDPKNYYGAASDYNNGGTTYGTLSHIHRFGGGSELKTQYRKASYERDQRASTIRLCGPSNAGVPNANCPTVTATPGIDLINSATILNRGTNNKIQSLDTQYLQSDYSGLHQAWGLQHQVMAGVDVADEKFVSYSASNLTPPGKPPTTVGTPDDGGSVNEGARVVSWARDFHSQALGVYAQDLLQVAPHWKVLVGLRWDHFKGTYTALNATNTADPYLQRTDSLWSKRAGVLYQPTDWSSFHFSYGTSFNTSGDTYQYDNQTANTPAESSQNLELGGKLDLFDKRLSARFAVFRSTKLHERNRDSDVGATQAVLSGKRHAAGIDLDLSGKITPQWEVFGSYAWIPVARIDVGAPGSTPGVGEGEGTRPSLTPKHSGTIWSTYQINGNLRVGGGLNARSSQTPNRNPGFAAPRFVTGDLIAEYKLEDYSFQLNVSNVTNKLYADSLYTGHYIQGAPRTIRFTMAAKF